MLSYRNTPQTSTNFFPAELSYKRKLNTRLHLLKTQITKEILKQEESKAFSESKDLRILYPGDQVWVTNYQRGDKLIEEVTADRITKVTYQ